MAPWLFVAAGLAFVFFSVVAWLNSLPLKSTESEATRLAIFELICGVLAVGAVASFGIAAILLSLPSGN